MSKPNRTLYLISENNADKGLKVILPLYHTIFHEKSELLNF